MNLDLEVPLSMDLTKIKKTINYYNVFQAEAPTVPHTPFVPRSF